MPIPLGVLAVAGAGAASAAGAYELLQSEILGSDTATVTFSNLNSTYGSTYQHLQIRAVARTTKSGGGDSLVLKINSATTGYRWHTLQGDGSSVTSTAQLANTFIRLGYATINSGTSNAFAAMVVDILDPFETTKNKTLRTLSGVTHDAYSLINVNSASWESTSAVDTMSFSCQEATNLMTGTRISLYGLRSA